MSVYIYMYVHLFIRLTDTLIVEPTPKWEAYCNWMCV